MDDAKTLSLAAGLGAIAGMRSFSAPLALSQAARNDSLNLAGTPLSLLGSANGAHVTAALALGELIADKTPFIPNRTDPPSLVARFASGALAGASIAISRKQGWIAAALIGGATAIGATFAAFELRRRAGEVSDLPDIVWALAEDAIVIGSAFALVSALKSDSALPDS
jgi:uncharacterized membrane protein